VVVDDCELDDVVLAERLGPSHRAAAGGVEVVRPSRSATHSTVVPCMSVERMTTKRPALTIVSLWRASDESTNRRITTPVAGVLD
jgi:hypothetical protein